MIHLDTSFLVQALAPGTAADRRLRGWLGRQPIGISAIGWTELLCGPLTVAASEVARGLVGEPVAFTGANAAVAARLFNATGRRRGSLADCMIAAAAIEAGASLATADLRDFSRFSAAGLVIA